MGVDDLDLFSDQDISNYQETAKDCGECCLAICDKIRYVINLKAICQISNSRAVAVGVCYNDY